MRLERCLTLFLGLVLALASHAYADIHVAQSTPLTGEAGASGRGLTIGAKICFDHINATEGGVNGQKIVHLVRDDACQISLNFSSTNHIGPHFVDLIVVSRTGALMR